MKTKGRRIALAIALAAGILAVVVLGLAAWLSWPHGRPELVPPEAHGAPEGVNAVPAAARETNDGESSNSKIKKKQRFGSTQLITLLHDRPDMNKYNLRNSKVWDWVIRKFEGEDLGEQIYWNPNPPDNDLESESQMPTPNQKAFIAIKRKEDHKDYTNHNPDYFFNMQWSALVFEFNNLAKSNLYLQVYNDALSGMSKKEWIDKNTRIEYTTVLDTGQFYESIWKPATKDMNIIESEGMWITHSSTYEEWIGRQYHYPLDSWGKYYDNILAPYLNKK